MPADPPRLVPLPSDDEPWKTLAEVRCGARRVGRVAYSVYPRLLYIWSIDLDGPPTETAWATAVEALVPLMPLGDGYCQYVHTMISDPWVAKAYKSSCLAPTATLVGRVGSRASRGESILTFPDALFHDATPADTQLTLVYEPPPAGPPITPAVLFEALRSPKPGERMAAIRAASRSEHVSEEIRRATYHWALLDSFPDVRRFACASVAGSFSDRPPAEAIDELAAHVVEPLRSLDELGITPSVPEGLTWDPRHGARNKRYALVYTWALLAMREDDDAMALLRPRLAAEAATHGHTRDTELLQVALADLSPGGMSRGIGARQLRGVFELLRYTVLRAAVVIARDAQVQDRFFWLSNMVDAIVPPGGAALPTAVHAPPPRPIEAQGELPPELRRTPVVVES